MFFLWGRGGGLLDVSTGRWDRLPTPGRICTGLQDWFPTPLHISRGRWDRFPTPVRISIGEQGQVPHPYAHLHRAVCVPFANRPFESRSCLTNF